jgi:hypothetical protein
VSPFERQCLGALELASRVLGEVDFTLSGVPGTCRGVLDQFTQEREIADAGGRTTTVSAAIVCPRSQFGRRKPALGMRVTIAGETHRLSKLDEDSISFTLWLGNVNR